MISVNCKIINGIILIPAQADGQSGCFAFDTGAMQTAVNKTYFKDIQGESVDIAKFSQEVVEDSANRGTLGSLVFSGVEKRGLPVLIMDLGYVENALKTIEPDIRFLGTLGIDVIRDYSVFVDYSAPELILNPEGAFEDCSEIPITLNKLPIISLEINGKECDFVLDTGANTCLLHKSFEGSPDIEPSSEQPGMVNVPAVRAGDREYESIAAVISDISAIREKVPAEGVIGYQILSCQRCILDFKDNRLLLEKQ